ncbi:MAG: outer membrane protein [Novosphingobium sp.]
MSAEAGVQAGINKQVDDNFLLGIEADFGTGATTTVSSPEVPANTPAAFVWTSKYKWKGTARLRAGIVAGKTLAYVTGGVALAKAEFSESSPATAFGKGTPGQPWGARSAGVFTGYVYGFGIEHDLGKVRMKAEFTRTSYGRHTACYMDFAGPTANVCWGSPGTNYNIVSSVPTATSMRIGFNFAF